MSEPKSLAQELPDLDVTTTTEDEAHYEGPDLAFGGVPIPTPPREVSPERVRFAVPAVLSFDGYEETFDVAILNLSANGVACTGPQGLAVRDRLRLNFRLNLSAHPHSFLCEVIWVQSTGNDEANYGLRFVDLDADLALHVLDTVRERVEGRASEWAMPIMPSASDIGLPEDTELPDVSKPPARWGKPVYVAAAAGMAAGIGLSLIVAAAASGLWRDSNDTVAEAAPAVEAPLTKLPLQPVVPPKPETAPPAEASKPAAEASIPEIKPATPTPEPAPVAQLAPAAPAKPEVPVETKASTLTSTPPGLDLELARGGAKATLVLPLNGYAAQKEVFWLNNPTRLVVDVEGRQTALARAIYELDSPFVSRVRVGHHPGKVRFVIETGKNVSSKVTALAQGNRLRVELQTR